VGLSEEGRKRWYGILAIAEFGTPRWSKRTTCRPEGLKKISREERAKGVASRRPEPGLSRSAKRCHVNVKKSLTGMDL